MTVKFFIFTKNKKARTTEVVIRTNILLSNKSDFLIPQLTTEANISRPFTRPIRFGLRIILMLKQLFFAIVFWTQDLLAYSMCLTK